MQSAAPTTAPSPALLAESPAPASRLRRHAVGPVAELAPGARRVIQVNGREIGVFNVNGAYRAVLNICPHEQAPVCKGHVRGTTLPSGAGEYRWGREGEVLLCPWHGWEFNLQDGKSLHDPACHLKTYETLVEDGIVFVLA